MGDFARYEVVRNTDGKHTVYGFLADGTRVQIDRLYLRDHDAEIAKMRPVYEAAMAYWCLHADDGTFPILMKRCSAAALAADREREGES